MRSRSRFIAVLLPALCAFTPAAFATDFGKMYLTRGQLQAAADAGALAGIYLVANGWKDSTVDSARAYTHLHKVDTGFYIGSTAVVAPPMIPS